jgi:2-polyprenyl-3-methyl-5-hydroxy-6-metoxy-1,4-benzoquinol methylase
MILDFRSEAEEWMDAADAGEPEFAAALRDLGRINRMTLASRPVLDFLDRLVAETGASSLSILDVGCGGGDMLSEIDRWATARGVTVSLTGLDRSPWAARYATANGVRARFITADLFELDPAERFDVVNCSLFTHHLKDPELVRFLRWLEARALRGWLISDLHRHWLPWVTLWVGFRLMRFDPMVIHDSTVSVARSFVRADWTRLLAEAGVQAQIRWVLPFRWTVSVLRR